MFTRKVLSAFAAGALVLTSVVAGGSSWAAGRTIYLAGNGKDSNTGVAESTPVATLKKALALAADGDTIRVSGQIVMTLGSDGQDVDKNVVIDKQVTIEGAGDGVLTFRTSTESKVYVTKDVVFKGLVLDALTETSSPFRIFANGHSLKFDNVKTTKDGSSQAPTIYTGQIAGGEGAASNAAVTFENSPVGNRIRGIYASNEGSSNTDRAVSAIPATITLDQNMKVELMLLGRLTWGRTLPT